MNEPSVLDYIKALLTPWKGKPPQIPAEPELSETGSVDISIEPSELSQAEGIPTSDFGLASEPEVVETPEIKLFNVYKFPWTLIVACVLALIAQLNLEPPDRAIIPAVILYILSAAFLIAGCVRKDWEWNQEPESILSTIPRTIRSARFWAALPFLLVAFVLFRGNRFTAVNLTFWIVGLVLLVSAFWVNSTVQPTFWSRIRSFVHRPAWTFRISRWTMLIAATVALTAFFRFYQLNALPAEMFSDHAEKLLDVGDVLAGKFSIFFPRNTGREALQMYLTALVGIVFGTKLSFLSLKIGTTLAGFFTLPYIYLLGKEIGNRWVGLFAFVLAGIAYWPNVISRVGLRFPLYPLFVAPTLFYLLRGLKNQRRNDFIWAGIALGIGLHGYSPIRILPVVVVAAVGLYLLHEKLKVKRRGALLGLGVTAGISLAIFLPLVTYMLENPDTFWYRALTRSGTIEASYPGSVVLIFLSNLWKSMIMFFFDNGNIWVHSIPNRPALDVISAALFFIGFVLILLRYIRSRNWLDLFLLVSIPLLMLPSILSLAFPDENPSLNRSGGAIIPVFILAAFGLEAVVSSLRQAVAGKAGKVIAAIIAMGVIVLSAAANYDLVFNQYDHQFRAGAWNTSEIGSVIKNFAGSEGNLDTAYVIPYPYWVDTRLVGINAGDPLKDYALSPDDLGSTLTEKRAKLFILNTADISSANEIQEMYPTGTVYLYDSELEGKDFLMIFVPPSQ